MRIYHIQPKGEDTVVERPVGLARSLLQKSGLLSRDLGLCLKSPTVTLSYRYPGFPFYYGYSHTFSRWLKHRHPVAGSRPRILGVALHDDVRNIIWFAMPKARHHNLLHLTDEYGATDLERQHFNEGFLTNEGQFVLRAEAGIIAEASDQLIRELDHHGRLYSENLFRGGIDINTKYPFINKRFR